MKITTEINIISRNRLDSFRPIVSVIINFAINQTMSFDENLKVLNKTIESILLQDYDNLEIIVARDYDLGNEYVKFGINTKSYGNVVHYVELSAPVGYEAVKERVKGGYVLLMNAGEYLIHSGYLTATVKKMVTYPDIGIVFANYSIIERPNHVVLQEDGLGLIDTLAANSWTKINGQWLFLNYDKLWCMPGTTIFRWKAFSNYLGNNIKNLNKLLFLPMLLDTKVAFHNHVVGKCRDGLDNGNGKLTLEHCHLSLEYIELATADALLAGCEKSTIQNWRLMIIKNYFSSLVTIANDNGVFMNGLYDIANKFGVMKLFHETIIEMVRKKKL